MCESDDVRKKKKKKQMRPSGMIQATIFTRLATRQVPKMQPSDVEIFFFIFLPFYYKKKCVTQSKNTTAVTALSAARKIPIANEVEQIHANGCEFILVSALEVTKHGARGAASCWVFILTITHPYETHQPHRGKCLSPLATHTSRGAEISSLFGNKQFSFHREFHYHRMNTKHTTC